MLSNTKLIGDLWLSGVLAMEFQSQQTLRPETVFSSRRAATMSLTLREENFVVIDLGSYLTKAGIGANDTNKPPSVVRTSFAVMTAINKKLTC
jgi:hypothetical protein